MIMKKSPLTSSLLGALALAIIPILAIPTTASAQTYIGISGGASKAHKSKNRGQFTSEVPATTAPNAVNGSIPSGTTVGWTTKFDTGYNISAQLGKRLENGLRVEGEFTYSRNGVKRHRGVTVGGANIDGADASILTRGTTAGATVGTVVNSGIGRQKSYGVMANAYYDIGGAEAVFQPYVGAGIGLQRTKFDYRPSNIDVGQGKDTNFAWQGMVGATYKMGSAELFGQYNYRDAGKTKMRLDLIPADLNAKSRQSIFSLGVRVPMGGK
jgi:hypothetical protein